MDKEYSRIKDRAFNIGDPDMIREYVLISKRLGIEVPSYFDYYYDFKKTKSFINSCIRSRRSYRAWESSRYDVKELVESIDSVLFVEYDEDEENPWENYICVVAEVTLESKEKKVIYAMEVHTIPDAPDASSYGVAVHYIENIKQHKRNLTYAIEEYGLPFSFPFFREKGILK